MSGRWDSLTTQRLLMRRWAPGDHAPYAAMNADPAVREFFPDLLTAEQSSAEIERFEARFEEQGYGLWALERRDTGTFIGFTGLHPMPADVPGAGGLEVGWRLAPAHWGQGFATEAARAALQLAFGPLSLTEVWSMTAELNLPSQAVMKRLGMAQRAAFEHPRVAKGNRLRPHVCFHLARPEPACN